MGDPDTANQIKKTVTPNTSRRIDGSRFQTVGRILKEALWSAEILQPCRERSPNRRAPAHGVGREEGF